MSSINYDHRLKLHAPIRIPFFSSILRVLFYVTANFVKTRVFGELNSAFSVCVFSGSTRDALIFYFQKRNVGVVMRLLVNGNLS
jgi:hypothetical protein